MPFKNVPKYYSVWASMKDRCTNQNNKQFKDYGGRGIRVCDRWASNYSAFEADMGERPEGYSIERKDNNGDYEPSNCKWASRKEQQRNRRYRVMVDVGGETYRAIELADIAGVKVETIVERANRGLPYSEVIRPDKIYNKDTSHAVAGHKAKAAARTHCKNGHEFTPENTHIRKDGAKQCRECHNAKMRRLTAKKREDALKLNPAWLLLLLPRKHKRSQ
ncbi:hypothetical protein MRBLRC7O_000925 [Agrobacterium radiobacter]|uniref:hypothetical protein n=1 Tax=Agrobacterium radiobacter TaxID=362 RepID=UPI0034650362